jgi:hypothetical protein
VKLYFELPVVDAPGRADLRRQWEAFIAAVAEAGPPGAVVFSPAQADVVIHAATEQFDDASLAQLMRPLSDADVRRIGWDWGDSPTGRYSGFYCSLESRLFDPRRHRTTCYPVAFNQLIEAFDQSDAVYDFGFMGGLTASVRVRLFEVLGPRQAQDNAFLKQQGADWATAFVGRETEVKRAYVDFLRQTKFVLCPRGYGAGSARLFETMKAGRAPVIISDAYVLPGGVDWDGCSIRVGEQEIETIPQRVAERMADWPAMARAARKAWEDNFSEAAIVGRLRQDIEEISADLPRVGLGDQLRHGTRVAATFAARQARPALGRLKRAVTSRLS